ncbi:ATP-binding cassette domain-containing protein [Collinsella sp. AGMB00827]|uniref:ATP-binding cassette domain-containing protein n=2 Tax=Collinsella ureilytica TaxID=2869515 RepID=A0ABS7MK44_9ACTN|nr:ATP-binding cassette domain-containing protein [Collinsella urealyticum]
MNQGSGVSAQLGQDESAAAPAGSSEPILSIRNLCRDFSLRKVGLFGAQRTLHALTDVSLDVYEGETLGLIGESGCGKSTLGRCVVQLHRATSGEILYRGREINGLTGSDLKAMRRNIQMVFQDSFSSLDPRFTAARAIEEPLLIHGTEASREAREQIVLDIMREVGLDIQHLERYPHEFSGGQRQRINIARALVLDPKIIVCDEPVSALDVSIQAQVLNLFRRLQRDRGLTYLFISHDLSVIRHISDRIAIMYLGRVVEICPAHRVYENPLHPYTQALLSAVPPESPFEVAAEIKLTGEIASPIGEQVGCPLAGRCPFVMERCRKECPALREAEPEHRVACFLHGDEAAA